MSPDQVQAGLEEAHVLPRLLHTALHSRDKLRQRDDRGAERGSETLTSFRMFVYKAHCGVFHRGCTERAA